MPDGRMCKENEGRRSANNKWQPAFPRKRNHIKVPRASRSWWKATCNWWVLLRPSIATTN